MDLFEPDCNLALERAPPRPFVANNGQFERHRAMAVLPSALTELNRILVRNGGASLPSNEADDLRDQSHVENEEALSAHRARAFMIPQGQEIGFYRDWSARAARQALSAIQRQRKERCAHSAGMWTLIADALEAGDDAEVASLMHNLVILKATYLVPAI